MAAWEGYADVARIPQPTVHASYYIDYIISNFDSNPGMDENVVRARNSCTAAPARCPEASGRLAGPARRPLNGKGRIGEYAYEERSRARVYFGNVIALLISLFRKN
jgi:hypothetical protein